MKALLLLALGWLICLPLQAQSLAEDPLSLTLSNGKILHFQTEEQKQKFEAGMARVKPPTAAGSAPGAPVPPPTAARPSAPVVPSAPAVSSLDFTPGSGPGIGNPTAPIFTAVYYMAAPESWVGKKVTIAIASLEDSSDAAVKDGLRRFNAVTWNNTTAGYLNSESGGTITVYTKPEMATRLLQLCGSKMQSDYYGRYKTTMVQGVFGKLAHPGKKDKGDKQYCVYVGK